MHDRAGIVLSCYRPELQLFTGQVYDTIVFNRLLNLYGGRLSQSTATYIYKSGVNWLIRQQKEFNWNL